MALYYHKARALSTLLFRPFAGEHGDGAVEWELGADKHAAPDEKNASRGRVVSIPAPMTGVGLWQ